MPFSHRLLVILLTSLAAVPAVEHGPNAAAIQPHADALIAIGDRSPGSDGAQQALDYIGGQLRAIGYGDDQQFRQSSSLLTQVDRPIGNGQRSHLRLADGSTLRVYPHMANGQAPSTTHGEAIEGTLVYLGKGGGRELLGQPVAGNIAVLDADSYDRWLTCAELGARAIIFIHPERLTHEHLIRQSLRASLDLPRFVCADWRDEHAGQQAALISNVVIEDVTCESLAIRIPGTAGDGQAAVVLTAGYESSGNILGLDVGATRAWNAALLLHLVERFTAQPAERDLVAIWNGGRTQAFRGLRDVLGSLTDTRHNTAADDDLYKEIGWPKAPLGNAEAVRLAISQWRTDLVAEAFGQYLAGGDKSEASLKTFLQTIDSRPEDGGYFDGLEYEKADADEAATGSAADETDQAAAEQPADDESGSFPWAPTILLVLVALGLLIAFVQLPGLGRLPFALSVQLLVCITVWNVPGGLAAIGTIEFGGVQLSLADLLLLASCLAALAGLFLIYRRNAGFDLVCLAFAVVPVIGLAILVFVPGFVASLDLATSQWVILGLVLSGGAGLVALYQRAEHFSPLALLLLHVPLIFFAYKILQPPAVFSGTDLTAERSEVLDLGHKFLSEEAARRADRLGPLLQELRLLQALLNKWTPADIASTTAAAQDKPARFERWRQAQASMTRAREMLAAHGVAVRPELAYEQIDDSYRKHIAELATDYRTRHQRWRNIQQKLGKKELTEVEAAELPSLVAAVAAVTEHGEGGDQDSLLAKQRRALDRQLSAFRSGITLRRGLHEPDIGLVVALDLSDGNDRFSSISKGKTLTRSTQRLHKEIAAVASHLDAQELSGRLAYEDGPYILGEEVASWWHSNYLHEAALAGWYAHAFTISTVNDARLRLGTPTDDAAHFDAERFLRQTDGLAPFLRQLVANRSIVERKFNHRPDYVIAQATVETRSEGSVDGKKGFPFPSLTRYFGELQKLGGDVVRLDREVGMYDTYRGDAFGLVRIPWAGKKIPEWYGGKAKYGVDATGYDDYGNISYKMATSGIYKTEAGSNNQFDSKKMTKMLISVFACIDSQVYSAFDPRLLTDLTSVRVLSAARESAPDYAHVETHGSTAVIFSSPGVRLRVLGKEGEIDNRLLLLGDHIKGSDFLGLEGGQSLSTEPIVPAEAKGLTRADYEVAERRRVPTAMANAHDMLALCRTRLENYQANGINPESTWAQLAEGQKHVDIADQALADGDLEGAKANGQAAWSFLTNVYPVVLSTGNDVVYGLVIMLLLAIPFSLICERLFVCGNTINRKVAGFSFFFVLVFLFFFFLHPAFDLATTPVIIFLAFVIILLSVLVIGLLYNRFEHEMQLIRMAGLGMHTADVTRFGTILSTGQLGISNMRRRPLRTFLTAITVVLMTFILLTFSSFKGSADTRSLSVGVPPHYTGILLHRSGWVEFMEETVDRVEASWSETLDIYQRWWLSADDRRKQLNVTAPEGTGSVEGIIAMRAGDPSAIESALVRGRSDDPEAPRGFGEEHDWIFLPPGVIERLHCETGQTVFFEGSPFRLGTIDIDRFANITHLGGDPITPLAMANMSEEQSEQLKQQTSMASAGETSVEGMSFTHLGPESTGVVHLSQARRIGAKLTSFALVPYEQAALAAAEERLGHSVQPGDQIDIDAIAEDMAHQIATTLVVGNRGDTRLMTSVSSVSVAGLTDVLIPLILGGLIIFSTMLGSVAERGKEIFIYSSLGLAPLHIGALFLVEASIYAVLGGLGGYIVAQLLVAGLGVLANMGIGAQPDLNYSSLTAVATILMVMATVLLSALYPALVASRSAKPGEDTDFTVPEPDGDELAIPFPFTVARRDVRGLLAFLAAYFEANNEASVGCFTAADTQMRATEDDEAYHVSAKTWLAPFDLGISQHFHLRAEPTDLNAIYRIHISLRLLSGQRNAWRRVVLPFLKELRKQFLVWRTLDELTMDRYRAAGGDEQAAERVAEAERLAQIERQEQEATMNQQRKAAVATRDRAAESAESADDESATDQSAEEKRS